MLRANLQFVNLDRGARSILVTSALEQEGKSTTVANLAVALARAGQRVALVDLDLRRPAIAKFFAIPKSHPGVTNVVVGSSTLEQALVEVGRTSTAAARRGSCRTETAQARPAASAFSRCWRRAGFRPTPARSSSAKRLTAVLEQLAGVVRLRPHRHASAALGRRRDGPERPRRRDDHGRASETCSGGRVLAELARALETCPTIKLGVVVTGAESRAGVRLRPQLRVPPHVEADGGMGAPFLPRPRRPASRRSRCGESWGSSYRRRGAVLDSDPTLDHEQTRTRSRRQPVVTGVDGPQRAAAIEAARVRRYLLVADLTALVAAFVALQVVFPAQAIGRPIWRSTASSSSSSPAFRCGLSWLERWGSTTVTRSDRSTRPSTTSSASSPS